MLFCTSVSVLLALLILDIKKTLRINATTEDYVTIATYHSSS